MRLEDSKADNGRIPTIEERLQLSYDIFKIDNTEMARVLTRKYLIPSYDIFVLHRTHHHKYSLPVDSHWSQTYYIIS